LGNRTDRLGATDADPADFFGVDVRTIYRWKHDHPEFCQALKAGNVEAGDRVERGRLYGLSAAACSRRASLTASVMRLISKS